jgi:putative AlgH/UPF0301 family transcriptional regulator
MSLRKAYLLIVLAVVAGFGAMGTLAAGGRLERCTKELVLQRPNTRPQDLAVIGDRSVANNLELTSGPVRSQWLAASGGKDELQAAVFLPVQSFLPVHCFLPVQSRNPKSLGNGKLLVASRSLGDPHFAKTVVLLVRFDAQGVVGLILNRRTDVPISRALENLKAAKGRSDQVYLGGPVGVPGVFALLESPSKIDGAEHVFGGIYLISAKAVFEKTMSARPNPDVFHVYLGYAGWTEDQLRKEVELGAWFIFPAETSTVFNSDPDSLWPRMIEKTELNMAGMRPADTSPTIRDAKFRANQLVAATY